MIDITCSIVDFLLGFCGCVVLTIALIKEKQKGWQRFILFFLVIVVVYTFASIYQVLCNVWKCFL